MRRVWAMAGQLAKASGVDKRELVYDWTRERFGKDSLRTLSGRELSMLQSWLEDQVAGLSQARKRKGPDPRVAGDEYCKEAEPRPKAHEGITREQSKALDDLRRSLGWSLRRYRGFCERQIGRSWPQTKRQAVAVHEGLEAMLRRDWPLQRIWDVATDLLEHHRDELTPWERRFLFDMRARIRDDQVLGFGKLIKVQEIHRKRGQNRDE